MDARSSRASRTFRCYRVRMQEETLPFIANTDHAWFDFLAEVSRFGRLDEVNFWQPKASRPMRRMLPGTPLFFRLKGKRSAIGGYGFFVQFQLLPLRMAWDVFGFKNGDPELGRFLRRISKYRGQDLLDPRTPTAPIGCNVLRNAVFWPPERWIPWGANENWPMNVVQGATMRDVAQRERLLAEIRRDATPFPAELEANFTLVDVDERTIATRQVAVREGQGAFRLRLLDVYEGQCAITGEHTQPVLDAAHVQQYLGPASNHVQNGLLLTKELHALFDLGYVTVTPAHVVRVSGRLAKDWNNGRRYKLFDGQPLQFVPRQEAMRPSRQALEWHADVRFLG